jgi:histidinol-phosphatase (PHP family)
MNPEEALVAASKLGLGLCVTEHVDYEINLDHVCVADTGKYFSEYAAFRPDGLLLGLEIGLTVNTRAVARKTASDPRLDFCVGAVHLCNGYDMFFSSFWEQGGSPKDIMGSYLKYIITVIDKCDFFDSLGHIDYPSRYCPFIEKDIKYDDFKALYNEIFTALLDKGKIMELNTDRINCPVATENLFEIFRGYYRLGGRYVTLGSDAHHQGYIGKNFGIALRLAENIGLKPVYYVQREMISDE